MSWYEDKDGKLVNLTAAQSVEKGETSNGHYMIRIHFSGGTNRPRIHDIKYRNKPPRNTDFDAIKTLVGL